MTTGNTYGTPLGNRVRVADATAFASNGYLRPTFAHAYSCEEYGK